MTVDLEREMWAALVAGEKPRDWIDAACESGKLNSEKQAWATLDKWCRENVYEYGVTLDLGWPVHGTSGPRRIR